MTRRMPWVKLPRSIFTDEEAAELSAEATLLRIYILAHCVKGEDGAGRLVASSGRPYTVAMVARMTPLDEGQVERGLAELRAVGLIGEDDAGVMTYEGWLDTQESPITRRTRAFRERSAAPAGNAGEPSGNERREENRSEEIREEERESARGAAPLALVPVEPAPADMLVEVVALFTKAAADLGLKRRPSASTLPAKVARAVVARGTSGEWATALQRAAEDLRREAERLGSKPVDCKGATYFHLENLSRPARWSALMSDADLDERRPQACRRTVRHPPRKPAPQGRDNTAEALRIALGEEEP